MATCYVPVCTTNLQILTVICCIHRHIHQMSRTPFLLLNFLDFDVYVVMTPIFQANQRSCASSSKNVAILFLWSKRAIIAPNKKIRMTEFYSPSLSIVITAHSKVSFLITLNYSKMIPLLVESFRNLHLFHSNATKT